MSSAAHPGLDFFLSKNTNTISRKTIIDDKYTSGQTEISVLLPELYRAHKAIPEPLCIPLIIITMLLVSQRDLSSVAGIWGVGETSVRKRNLCGSQREANKRLRGCRSRTLWPYCRKTLGKAQGQGYVYCICRYLIISYLKHSTLHRLTKGEIYFLENYS